MSIRIENVSKRFGDFAALDDIKPGGARRRVAGIAGAVGFRQDHLVAGHCGTGTGRRRPRSPGRRGCLATQRAGAAGGLRVPALRAVPAHDSAREHRLRAARATWRRALAGAAHPRTRHRTACPGATGWPGAQVSLATFRRAASTRGPGAGVGDQAQWSWLCARSIYAWCTRLKQAGRRPCSPASAVAHASVCERGCMTVTRKSSSSCPPAWARRRTPLVQKSPWARPILVCFRGNENRALLPAKFVETLRGQYLTRCMLRRNIIRVKKT